MTPIDQPVTTSPAAKSSAPDDACPAAASAPPPYLVIAPASGWRGLNVRELWHYRDLLYFLAWRDVKVRYKQTVLGAAWAIIQPVLTMVVFSIFFGRLGGLDEHTGGVPYPIFVYAGILPWMFFANSVTQSAQSLITSSNLISKVYFPRLIVPVSAIGSCLMDFIVALGVMLLLMLWYGTPWTLGLVTLPLLAVGLIIAAVGAGALLAALTVEYRDFRYVVPFMVQIWMFASPVAYPLHVVPEEWRLLYALNPMSGLIAGFRSALLAQSWVVGALAVSTASALALLACGALYFRRVERRIADIV